MNTQNSRVLPTLIIGAAIGFAGVIASFGQTKTWTGSGDGVSWANGANWSGGTVPGDLNDVVINGGSGTGVVISSGNITIRSLQCTKAFTISGGSLRVTGGNSQVSGAFAMANDGTLTVTGAGVNLSATGPTTAADANLYATYGGAIHLPNLRSVTNNNNNTTWHADGPGALLDLSSLTNVAVGYYRSVRVEAFTGGAVDLHRLSSANASVDVDARDGGSVVDLSGLVGRWVSLGNSPVQLEAQTGGIILIPNVTQLEHAELRVDNTGAIPTAQLNLLTNVLLTADASAPNFGRVTNIDETSVYALNGGAVRLTNVFRSTYSKNNPTWNADGSGSLVELSMLTNINVGFYRTVWVQAYNGGGVDLHRLKTAEGALDVDARASGIVDLSGLDGRWRSLGNSPVQLEAQTGGIILIPNVTQLEHAELRVDNTGAIPTAQLNLLTNVLLTADACAPNFGRVTNIDETSLRALNGGVLRLTNVFRVTEQNVNPTWHADGSGGLIGLSSLTNITLGYYRMVRVEAFNGGGVDLRRLRTAEGALDVDVRDPGSVVDLSGLSGRWTSLGNSPVQLEAQTGAIILIPNVTQMEHVEVRVHNTGLISTAQLSLLTNVVLTIDAAAPNLGRVTNVDDTTIRVLNGGVARLTNVFSAVVFDINATWHVDGAGGLIDLSSLTNLALGYYRVVWMEAFSGGAIDLHGLKDAPGALDIDARNAGSRVDLSGLSERWRSEGNSPVKLEAQTGASILIPNVTQLEHAEVRVDNTGTISTAQLNLLTNVDLTVDGCAPNFGQVTNIDETSVHVLNAGVARLTNVYQATYNERNAAWEATGAGSLLDMASLRNLSVGFYRNLDVSARGGGKVDLHSLLSLSTGAVDILADGNGSVVDLRGISSFVCTGNGPASVTARNNGVILFNDSVFLLANVSIDIPPGNPVLPPTLAASPGVTLYGKAWHAYWVEKRDTRSPLNPWVFVARVPLTSSLQPVIPDAQENIEYRAWDFEADPPIADMQLRTDGRVFMVIYDTPGKTNQVSTSQSLLGNQPWESSFTTVMTNAFRIRQLPNPVEPERYFRVKRL